MVAIQLAILLSGHMHAHRSQPVWVTVTSWVFAVAGWTLIVVGFIALRRLWRRRRMPATTVG